MVLLLLLLMMVMRGSGIFIVGSRVVDQRGSRGGATRSFGGRSIFLSLLLFLLLLRCLVMGCGGSGVIGVISWMMGLLVEELVLGRTEGGRLDNHLALGGRGGR